MKRKLLCSLETKVPHKTSFTNRYSRVDLLTCLPILPHPESILASERCIACQQIVTSRTFTKKRQIFNQFVIIFPQILNSLKQIYKFKCGFKRICINFIFETNIKETNFYKTFCVCFFSFLFLFYWGGGYLCVG